jgi:hypothetical protein
MMVSGNSLANGHRHSQFEGAFGRRLDQAAQRFAPGLCQVDARRFHRRSLRFRWP